MTQGEGLPTFVTIGAMKCGTTSLHRYLAAHPDFSMSSKKEPNFFLQGKNWSMGFDWYRSLYDLSKPHRGESSVNYTKFPAFPDAPAKMAECIPDAKLVFVARDPIDRIRSHHAHQISAMNVRRDLDLERDKWLVDYYITCSRYAMQISRFLEFFPRDHLHVVCSTALRNDTARAVSEVITFLGADATRLPEGVCDARYHESDEKYFPTSLGRLVTLLPHGKRLVRSRSLGPLSRLFRTPAAKIEFSESVTDYLRDQLAEDAAEFRTLSGRDFAHWSV
jgi:hypothetical protein